MLPLARRTCSSWLLFIGEPLVNRPSFRRRKDSTKGTALTQPLSGFGFRKQDGPNGLPFLLQNRPPLRQCRRWIVPIPTRAGFPRVFQTRTQRVAIDLCDNRLGKRQTALINFLMRSHGA